MKSKILLVIVFALFTLVGNAQESKAKPADEILKEALQIASKENKNVFLMWHASWCGWCHKMDTLMNDSIVKEYFDDSFVIKHLVVKESKKNVHLENPGAAEILAKYNGDKAGIPFWIVMDKKGELLADSFMREPGVGMDQPGKNTGCPQNPDEVEHWIKVLKKTTDISKEGLAKIKNKFTRK